MTPSAIAESRRLSGSAGCTPSRVACSDLLDGFAGIGSIVMFHLLSALTKWNTIPSNSGIPNASGANPQCPHAKKNKTPAAKLPKVASKLIRKAPIFLSIQQTTVLTATKIANNAK
jgi:hypothetical protein